MTMDCKNGPGKINYKDGKIPPSPKGLGYCARNEEEGVVMQGHNGNMWMVKANVKGTKQWKEIKDGESPKKSHKKASEKKVHGGMTVAELREALKAKGLDTSGKKDALKRRLAVSKRGTKAKASGKKTSLIDGMKVADLKAALKAKGLDTSGKKDELKKRLAASSKGTKKALIDGMKVVDLKAALKAKGLATTGKKDELKKRLAASSKGTKAKASGKKDMTVAELKEALKAAGLKTSGKKTTLKRRLASSKGTKAKAKGRPKKN